MIDGIRRYLVLGLAGAGKSTFIAALRQVTEAGDVEGALRLVSLGENDRHVNALHDQWLKCEMLERTTPEQEQVLRFQLAASGSEAVAELEIPDLSGELIEQQWSLRLCPPQYREAARACSGAVLFIHPNNIASATLIADANAAMSALGGDDELPTPAKDDEPPMPPKEYDVREAQTQMKLVELLQFLMDFREDGVRTPIAVVVSAWDIAERAGGTGVRLSPNEWIKRFVPLLYQFLTTNADRLPWRPYGISAQGGDLKADLTMLLGKAPSERVRVVDGDTETRNVTAPIIWLEQAAGVASR